MSERQEPASAAEPERRARIRLAPGRDRPLRSGHPWLYSGAIAREEEEPKAALAEVEAADGAPLGLGFYSPRSRIRVRMLGAGVERVDSAFFAGRLAQAIELRRLVVPAETDGYRVVNAEGDGLPGWTVDRFGPVLISEITVAGLERLRGQAYTALQAAFPGLAVVHLGSGSARRAEGLDPATVVIAGELPDPVRFRERGMLLRAEIGGQKTGFYCDQRESRRRVEALAGGRRVLDLFAHAGGFSLFALRGGAREVTAVESARRLIEAAGPLAEENGLDRGRLTAVCADVFRDLRERQASYDLVVCDPPPLARRRSQLDAAARAYKDVNRLALARLAPGGLLLTFSCSGAVDARLFRQILFAAADEAGARLQLLEPLAAAPDHPVSVFHPEGEYLKGWLARVAGPGGEP